MKNTYEYINLAVDFYHAAVELQPSSM